MALLGTSGFSRETADIADDLGFRSIFIARDKGEIDLGISGRCCLESSIDLLKNIKFIIGIGDNLIRRKLAMRFSNILDL